MSAPTTTWPSLGGCSSAALDPIKGDHRVFELGRESAFDPGLPHRRAFAIVDPSLIYISGGYQSGHHNPAFTDVWSIEGADVRGPPALGFESLVTVNGSLAQSGANASTT
jgi:hypothetical protein